MLQHLEGGLKQKKLDATGIKAIDEVRQLIDNAQWDEAKEEVSELLTSDDGRTQALAKLYSAVIDGQGSQSVVYSSDPVVQMYQSACESLSEPSDLFRAEANFGSYLLSKSQSRVYNHAIQAATDLQHPFSTAIWLWSQAQQQFAKAEAASAKLGKSDRASIAMNEAKLYATMGDFLRTLGSDDKPVSKLIETAELGTGICRRHLLPRTRTPTSEFEQSNQILADLIRRQKLRDNEEANERPHLDSTDLTIVMQSKDVASKIAYLHNLHGIAMAIRFRGETLRAVREYRALTASVNRALDDFLSGTGAQGHHTNENLERQLLIRIINTQERLGDCNLFGLPNEIDVKQAVDDYRRARSWVHRLTGIRRHRTRAVLLYKSALALAMDSSVSDTKLALAMSAQADMGSWPHYPTHSL